FFEEAAKWRGKMSFLKAFGVVSSVTLLSRILGLLRDLISAYFFGASLLYDSFLTAFTVPNLLRALFGEGALNAAVIPVFAEQQKDSERSREFVASLFGWVILVVGAIVVAGVAGALVLNTFLVDEKWRLVLDMFWRMFPFALFICLVATYGALLNVKDKFFAPAAAPTLFNSLWIGALLIFGLGLHFDDRSVAIILCYTVLFSGFVQLSLQMVSARKAGISPSFSFKRHPSVVRVQRLMLPMLFGLALFQLNSLADRLIVYAFVPKEGGVVALFYSNRLVQFPLALIGIAAATALFPAAAKAAKEGNSGKLLWLVRRSVRTIILLALPASVALILLRNELITLLFKRGRFDEAAVARTSDTLFFYSLGLVFFCLAHIVTRLYYSQERIKPVLFITAICTLLNLIMNLVLVFHFAEGGVALATSISSALNFILLVFAAGKEERASIKSGFIALIPASLGCVAMVVVIMLLKTVSLPPLTRLILCVLSGATVYTILLALLKTEELWYIIRRRKGD
ncbi:MAG: murein biosynthesis integral membrane protein MurJ, partial [Planctomycetota bacterium]|nr:murein biosynthesis integral membrane protein MurJ [Planctomycetota bacterium]